MPGDEREILAAFRLHVEAGNPVPADIAEAVDALFGACQGRVYAVCRKILREEEAARDMAQEALLTGYRKLHTFRGESSFGTWLYGIAKMLCMNAIRRRSEMLTEDGVLEAGEPTLPVISQLRRQEREALLRDATQQLSPLEQEALHLRYVEGLPQDRITEVLGIEQASGARGILQKCRRALTIELRARAGALGHGSSLYRESLS